MARKSGLVLKLAKLLKCSTVVMLIDNKISNRRILVFLNDKQSHSKCLNA